MKRPALLLSALAVVWACAACGDPGAVRGQALYEGEVALTARLVGHTLALPAQATRCINCHDAAADDAARARAAANVGWSGPLARTAPPLDRAQLTQRQSRRGGPPSAYDAAALCRLLRSGMDPADVLVPGVMPRYDLPDTQCVELWSYLSRR